MKFQIAVICLSLLALAVCIQQSEAMSNALNDVHWHSFKRMYGKSYTSTMEELKRRSIWLENANFIEKHNMEAENGMHTYRVKMNQFGDMTNEEFVRARNGFNVTLAAMNRKSESNGFEGVNIPDSVDWRTKGYVAKIKNQGQCGSCWAFTAVDALEGQHFKKTGNLVELSEQQLVDCSQSFGNMGCNGGLPDQAFKYIIANKGIDTLASYPYVGQTQKCQFKASDIGATESSFVDVKGKDESAFTAAIATIGPISTAMDASRSSFQFYSSGIYSDPQCSSTQLDHGVTGIGYGTDAQGNQYYIMRNMWGTDWGSKGYFLIARNKNNMCGVATMPSYPVV